MKMSKEDIISMAREAGFAVGLGSPMHHKLQAFAALVAAASASVEREACAKVVEASPSYDWHRFACEAAAAIRARNKE